MILVYSFRAWVDKRGTNCDRAHARHRRPPPACNHPPPACTQPPACNHLRLWDLNTNRMAWNIIRVVRRRHPFALGLYVGKRCRVLLNVGLPGFPR